MAADVFGNARVGNYRNYELGILAEVANVLAHLLRAGGTVHSEHIDWKRLDRRERRSDLGSHQHRAERFDGDLGDYRNTPLRCFKLLEDRRQCRFSLQNILTGFDDQQIRAVKDDNAISESVQKRFHQKESYLDLWPSIFGL